MRRPLFIARQASCPSGLLGRAIAAIMVRETARTNRAAIAALKVLPGDHVLDVGCGSGHSLELLAPLVAHGSVSGADPSPLMAAQARNRNGPGVAEDRIVIVTAAVERLPFVDETFDAVMSVHTVYFWDCLGPALTEIYRVMRSGGRLVLAFRTDLNQAATASFPSEVYRIRSLPEISKALTLAGFEVISLSPDGADGAPAMLVAHKPARALSPAPP